jgi:hypothetical protein
MYRTWGQRLQAPEMRYQNHPVPGLRASAGEARPLRAPVLQGMRQHSLGAQRAVDRGERRAQSGPTSDRAVEETMTKVLYKPAGMLVSVLGGVLAGAIFKQVWKVTSSEDDAPNATDADRSWREVLLAAALQGAIFGLVKAAVDRGAAEGTRKVTGVWPGEEGQ